MNLSTQVAIVTALFALILGVLVWLLRYRTRTRLPFSLVCLSVFVFCTAKTMFVFTGNELYARLGSVGGLFILASFFYLFVVFALSDRKAFDFAILVVFALAAAVSVAMFIPRLESLSMLTSQGTLAVTWAFAALMALGLIFRLRSEPPGRQRRLILTVIGFDLLLCIVYGFEKISSPMAPIQPWTLFVLAAFLYLLYFAMVQYRSLGMRVLVGKLAVLLASAIFLAIIYGLLVYLIGTNPILFGFHTLVAAFLLLILYEPILARVEAGTLRWLFRGSADKRQRIGALSRDLAGRISIEDVIDFLTDAFPKTLGYEKAGVYFLNQDVFAKAGDNSDGPSTITSEQLTEMLLAASDPIAVNPLRRQAFDSYPGTWREGLLEAVNVFSQLNANVVIPLRYQEQLLGFWYLDTGQGAQPTGETGEVLMSMADQAAVRIENARIYERLRIRDRLATVGEMAAGLAHEIRNPLGSMKGAAEFISDEPLPESTQEFVGIIIEEAARLDAVLGRFLDYARSMKVDFALEDVGELVRRTAALIAADEACAGVEVSVNAPDELIQCELDGELIRQVLINLVKNSIEAMMGQGKLRITVSQNDESALIEVADNGPGIAPEKIGRLFEPFFTTKKEGSGLGLAISQRICQAHKGSLQVVSTPGNGATFTIEIPLRVEDENSD